MKTKMLILIALVLTVMIGCKCKKKKKDEDINQLGLLPPLTHTGANKAGCLVNGQAFLPYGYVAGGNLKCFYIDGNNFSLGFIEKKNGEIKSVHIAILNDSLITGKAYMLKIYNDKYGEFAINAEKKPSPNYYSTTDKVVGELTITNHIFNKAILSGTFWFDAINSNGEIMQIREGRFDMEY
jgi:hypothetical protein